MVLQIFSSSELKAEVFVIKVCRSFFCLHLKISQFLKFFSITAMPFSIMSPPWGDNEEKVKKRTGFQKIKPKLV